jgi:hypothetical protein
VAAARIGPPPGSVRALELDGDISLYDAATRQALMLNGTASDIWRLADGAHTLVELTDLLAAAYGVPAEQIGPEVERTVRSLVEAGFLPS